jgi:hypothetical protein
MAELTSRDLFKAAGATAAAIGVVSLPGMASALLSSPAPSTAVSPTWKHTSST